VEDLQKEPPSSKDRLVQGHRVRHMIESIMLTTEKLVRFLSSSRQFLIFFSISRICFYVSSLLNTLDQSRETWVADFFLNNRFVLSVASFSVNCFSFLGYHCGV
jgi:hypothetical protein